MAASERYRGYGGGGYHYGYHYMWLAAAGITTATLAAGNLANGTVKAGGHAPSTRTFSCR